MAHFILIYCTVKATIFRKAMSKGLWNFLWTIRNPRWTTSGPPGQRWESLV